MPCKALRASSSRSVRRTLCRLDVGEYKIHIGVCQLGWAEWRHFDQPVSDDRVDIVLVEVLAANEGRNGSLHLFKQHSGGMTRARVVATRDRKSTRLNSSH